MEPQDSQTPQKSPNGYGKRPVWQWVVLYVVLGVIVYGLIYVFFIRESGGSSPSPSIY